MPDITVRESMAVAGLEPMRLRWVEKQLRLGSRRNQERG